MNPLSLNVKINNMLAPVLKGVEEGNLHFQVPSMNWFNQTEPATFSILPSLAFFRASGFLFYVIQKTKSHYIF
jgi:hypothetical protein